MAANAPIFTLSTRSPKLLLMGSVSGSAVTDPEIPERKKYGRTEKFHSEGAASAAGVVELSASLLSARARADGHATRLITNTVQPTLRTIIRIMAASARNGVSCLSL